MSPIMGLLPGRPAESLHRGYAAIVTTPPDEPVGYTEIRALPVDLGEQAGDQDAVVGGVEAAGERLLELRDLRPQSALGELGERGRVAHPAEQRLRVCPILCVGRA